MKRSAQRILTPSNRQLPPEDSHSDSGSHLSDRHATRTWMVMARLVTAPKEVMASDADLLYRRHMVVMGREGEGREGERGEEERGEPGKTRDKRKKRMTYLAGLKRIISVMTECRLIERKEDIKSGWLIGRVRTIKRVSMKSHATRCVSCTNPTIIFMPLSLRFADFAVPRYQSPIFITLTALHRTCTRHDAHKNGTCVHDEIMQ